MFARSMVSTASRVNSVPDRDDNDNEIETLYVVCDEEGSLLQKIAFAHAPTAQAFHEGEAEEYWERMGAEEGLHEAAVPTIEWIPIDPPRWAYRGAPAWAGHTEACENPAIVAGIAVERRALARGRRG
jgi:hypothetical protein